MRYFLYLILLLSLTFCGSPEPRRPVKVKTGNILKESVVRNKALLAHEEELIQEIIRKDSANTYRASGGGTWFHYINRNEKDDYYPNTDDLVTFRYNIMSLENDTIYTEEELGTITYKVDKQELFQGLRNSIKLLKEHESATFLIPSSMAYGYHGDKDKIGVNIPIKTTITLLKIDKNLN